MKKKNTSRLVLSHITVGIELAMFVLVFVYGGYKLDEYYKMSPLFVALGAFIGMALGFYHLIKSLQDINSKEKENDQKKIRNRWM